MSWQPSIGAQVCDGGVSFRVWAPDRRQVEVVLYAEDRMAAVSSSSPITMLSLARW